MAQENISGFDTPDPSVQSFQINSSTPIPSSHTSGSSPLTKSSIERSEIEALALLLAASQPNLLPPASVATHINHLVGTGAVANNKAIMEIEIQAEKTKNDIINNMWTAYQKGVEESAKRAKADYLRHLRDQQERTGVERAAGGYLTYLMSLSSGQRTKEIDSTGGSTVSGVFAATLHQWAVAPVQQGITEPNNNYPSAAFISGALLANSGLVRSAIGDSSDALGFQMSVSPVADALTSVGPVSGLPGDYQAAAALVAALLNGGAMYKATFDTIEEKAGQGKKPEDIDFAINYAKGIMNIVKNSPSDDVTQNKEQVQQKQLIRVMLSTMALNLLYRASYGGMTGEEFASLLKGNTNVHPEIKSLMTSLVDLLKSLLPQAGKARSQMIASLMEFVDSKTSVDDMLATTHLFKSLISTDDVYFNRLEANPT